MAEHTFDDTFRMATGLLGPIPFQRRFAADLPPLVHVPTGLGKTAMVVLGWLWRRFGSVELRLRTPRRLVYCLPMRVLVEQTRTNAEAWISNLRKGGGLPTEIPVHILMGGEDECGWDLAPERDAIIIGTQDMLLSRALNRGYAASRARWPLQFGLLNCDCLWVFDEIQLMGSGLATTAQLEAFRQILGPNGGQHCRSVWMSATMQPDWLRTVDFDPCELGNPLRLEEDDLENGVVESRWNASKPLHKAGATMGDARTLASEVLHEHKPGTRTIAVVNTVQRACDLFDVLAKLTGVGKGRNAGKGATDDSKRLEAVDRPSLVLLHSRFRPLDRAKMVEAALVDVEPDGPGTIVVSTQVIEAGVDVTATTLFTEVAPWASLVQRFGRCNRRGENADARVFWIELPEGDPSAGKAAPPYDLADVRAAVGRLKELENVGLKSLPKVDLPFEHTHVIRRKDMVDLFDTTPDLAGNDIDIDRFVRNVEETDVRVFWRDWPQPKGYELPPDEEPAARREELCPAPVGRFREFVKKQAGRFWRWSFLDGAWERVDAHRITPGQVYLVHADSGGYSLERGWDEKGKTRVEPFPVESRDAISPDANDDDAPSRISCWQTIPEHTDGVCRELDTIIDTLPLDGGDEVAALETAARWHDRGKAHEVFRDALPDEIPDPAVYWAKAPGTWNRYVRRHFRHELASALAVLTAPNDLIPESGRDLVAYLVAAHHGKVRLSIRSLPTENHPGPPEDDQGRRRRFARGVWDGDALLATALGGGVTAPSVTLSLEPMELGLCEHAPFVGQPSWVERMIRLRDTLGPFRLAYLEAILRAADMRASKAAEHRTACNQDAGLITNTEGVDNG